MRLFTVPDGENMTALAASADKASECADREERRQDVGDGDSDITDRSNCRLGKI